MEQFNFNSNNSNEKIEHQNEVIWSWFSNNNELEQQNNTKEILQSRNEQELKAELLNYRLEYEITKDDFDVKIKDGVPIIYSKSTYFSSLLGLNWSDEKRKCLNGKINKNVYDEFDQKINDKTEWKTEIEEFCKENWINTDIVGANGGCVYDNYVCIKYTPYVQCEEKKDWIEPTIKHESQHVKFNKYCEENWIEKNWYLKILDEVIAHCLNTKDENWNIDFDGIEKSMINNENYRKNSWFIEDYGWILMEIIQDVKNNIKDGLDETMKILVNKYKN